MSFEHSPARSAASFSPPDASLTIDEFCRPRKSIDAVRGMVGRLGPKFYRVRRSRDHFQTAIARRRHPWARSRPMQ